jgi:hypothetical protein
MIVFAILGLLIGLLFMFVRQKLSALESRVNLLTDTVQTMAGFRRVESDTEDDTDEESESEEEEEETYFPKIDSEESYFPVIQKETPEMPEPEIKVVSDDEIELTEINEVDVKKIQLEGPDYESLSLKELKDKVSNLGGPKLRTKKELLDFLKNIN